MSLSFSTDGKFLLSLTCGPEFTLHYWSWEKAKILASVKAIAPTARGEAFLGQVVTQCLINPVDATQISVIGNGIFKL